ncbi:hypothetical protein [Sphingomonas qomolangmaensis]|uniref:Uncharacterized protein n=1 Tax=Sphingomonas qomolangmaensis TaxID=2918765 RepID=A0ABY5L975_9SPHN|nr:hypothetical protein [Sphingomonas qomolangmaensis]UUL82412.1 hypothetical protein NMP03_14760 [Sphingomonas qomolangmaensis]
MLIMIRDRNYHAGGMTNPFTSKFGCVVELTGDGITALGDSISRHRQFIARQGQIGEGAELGPMLVILEGCAFRYNKIPGGTR